jgi:gas vesicle protein/ElaB/YqjD/DUF883 family membrane-anchored ribosome-binding protein
MTAPKIGDEDKTALIRGDIERTRGDMSRTVNEIEDRLSPAHIKEQVASVTSGVKSDLEQKVADLKESVIGGYHETKDHLKDDLGRELRDARHMVSDEITHARTAVRDATVGRVEHMVHDARESVTDAGTSVLDTIKANPIPAAMIGLGLGWLIFGSARGARSVRSGSAERTMRRYRLVEGAEGVAHDASEKVSHLAEDAGHRVAEVAGDAREKAMHLAGDARVRGQRVVRGARRRIMRAERGVESTLRENPLALGAVAIAIGAAIGLSLPHTHIEDEWMGDTKDRLLHRAEGMAGEAIHKAEETVGQLTAGERADQDKADGKDQTPDTSKNGLSNGTGGSKSQAV